MEICVIDKNTGLISQKLGTIQFNNLMMIVEYTKVNCNIFMEIKLIYENVKGFEKNLLSLCI